MAVDSPVAVALVFLAATLATACGHGGKDFTLTVRAELAGDTPVEVAATPLQEDRDGRLVHGVRVTWRGEGAVFLDDARFTHNLEDDGSHLVLAGRGCGADWDAELRRVVHPCTDDLQIVRLEPGESHTYPVTVYREVGPLKLARAGTFNAEERIRWWSAAGGAQWDGSAPPAGEFTVQLTYLAR